MAHLPENTTMSAERFTFSFVAFNGKVKASGKVVVTENGKAAPPPPPPAATAALSISANSIASTGGLVVLTYSSTNAASCTLSSSPALWAGSDPESVSCSGTYDEILAATATEKQWTFTFTATNSAGQPVTSTQTLTEQAPPPIQSPNWSGYVVSPGPLITETSGEWTVPTLDCAVTPNAGASTWVGIGGTNSALLLQTGVTDECVGGAQQDFPWWEEYPDYPNQSQAFNDFPVSPGDSMEAFVYQDTDGSWATVVDDLSTGLSGVMVTGAGWGVVTGVDPTTGDFGPFTYQGYTTDLSFGGGYTAEWIVEDYELGGSYVPFADYGTVTFSDLEANLSPPSLTPGEGSEIIQNGVVLSTPALPVGNSFSVSYTG
jgi:hypothetical protein